MSRISRILAIALPIALALVYIPASARGAAVAPRLNLAPASIRPNCSLNAPTCTEVYESLGYQGVYTGHDEPSLLFYDNRPGAGNAMVYTLTLPKDPSKLPAQDGTRGTFNFQLHPAFWFGMAMCDSQSFPEFTLTCTPDSDGNIFNSPDPLAPDYIGRHPGTAFMELQFYAPGWIPWPPGDSCDATQWCAALNIDSLSANANTGQANNPACLAQVGIEPVNFAFVTKSGAAHAPANPVEATLATYTPDPNLDLFMNSGDSIQVAMHDTSDGFQVVLTDTTTHRSGSMTASISNDFGQVKFDPSGNGCTNVPYAFHPMYSTSSEDTRVPWAAHSYNIAFSDEIGHFEYCNGISGEGGVCTQDGVHDTDATVAPSKNEDDVYCFDGAASTRIAITGCFGSDLDFDGPEYSFNWPGTNPNPAKDAQFHARPIQFSSPLFTIGSGSGTGTQANYQRVAFEADLPRIEFASIPPCIRTHKTPGPGCVNPPTGASFYPIYTAGTAADGSCVWQLGGIYIPGTTNTFGGTSTSEYGPILQLFYPDTGGITTYLFEDFHNGLSNNPCPASA